jgi:hypothetical protein
MNARLVAIFSLCIFVTLAQLFWLSVIGRQYGLVQVFLVHMLFLMAVSWIRFAMFASLSAPRAFVLGAISGYVVSLLSAGVIVLLVYEKSQWLDRFFPSGLIDFPIFSFVWLYCGICFVAMEWVAREWRKSEVKF